MMKRDICGWARYEIESKQKIVEESLKPADHSLQRAAAGRAALCVCAVKTKHTAGSQY